MEKGNKNRKKYKNATQGNEPISNSKPRQNPSDIRSSERIRYCRIAHDHDKYKGFAFGDAKIGDKWRDFDYNNWDIFVVRYSLTVNQIITTVIKL